jgi:hypothetical protein
MFDKVTNLAERAATAVGESRRGFLGRVGHAALVAAGALGAVALASRTAHAGRHSKAVCCHYANGQFTCVGPKIECPASYEGFPFVSRERNCAICAE